MTNPDFDLVIQDIKRDYRTSLDLIHEELVTRLGNAFENVVSNPKSICEEIKNSLNEEIADEIVSARMIEHHCPDKWKSEYERMSDSAKRLMSNNHWVESEWSLD